MSQEVYHIPALLEQSLAALNIQPDGTYVDATFGGGGHSRAIVERLGAEGHLYSFDQDEDAVKRAFKDPRFTIVYGNFRYITNFMRYYQVEAVDGILADLGVSFHHFDDGERGFSFRNEGPLDMRMSQHSVTDAPTILAEYSEKQLADIFYLYGELKQSHRLAASIVKARSVEPITRVEQLLAAIRPHINPKQEKKELAQVFQALRIEVNGEITALETFLESTLKVLRPGGRLAIITYHSLEDRLVKNFMRSGNLRGEIVKDFFGRVESPIKQIISKPITPDEEEVERNPRSRSAKLRIAEKL
jgi:16S rRNA (cytosine1402-N4)-methyltransferase